MNKLQINVVALAIILIMFATTTLSRTIEASSGQEKFMQQYSEGVIKKHKDNPQKVMEIYSNDKRDRQERLAWKPGYFEVYETYLQEHGLIDPNMTKDDLRNDFIFGALEIYRNDTIKLRGTYSRYMQWLQEKGFSTQRLEEKYKHLLKPQKEAP